MSKRYFINNLDTPFGQEFYNQLVKEDVEEGIHMATYKDDSNLEVPKGFKKILKRAKPKLSRKKMLEECDVYVYDLATSSKYDLEYVCGIFNNIQQLDEQKVLIIVSSILTWSDMGRKIKPKVEKKPEDEDQEPQQNQEQEPNQDEDQANQEDQDQEQFQEQQAVVKEEVPVIEEPPEYVAWEEGDYKERQAKEQYNHLKELEDMALAIQKENFKVIVVCSGLQYGKGEQILFKYFKKAWLQEPYKLSYQGEGLNRIPTVHITDLVKMIVKVAENVPEQNYVFAIDNTQNTTQKAIIQGIATGAGSGWIEQSEEFFQDFEEEELNYLQLNLEAKVSNLFLGNEENPVDFEWHCEKGIAENAKKILQEFTQVHKLRPLKIFMQSTAENMRFPDILNMFSQHYRIPIITQEQIFKDARDPNFVFPSELQEDFGEYWEFIENYMKEGKAQKQMSEQMKIYYKIIKWRLSQNDCSNRGYILVNFPFLQEECDFIFYPNKNKLKLKKKPKKKLPPPPPPEVEQQTPEKKDQEENQGEQEDQEEKQEDEQQEKEEQQQQEEQQQDQEEQQEEQQEEEEPQEEEQQEEEEEEGGPKPEAFFPESIVVVKPLDKGNKVQYNTGVMDYFSERGLDSYFIDSRLRTNHDVFENIRIYVERNGRPSNYLLDERILINQYFGIQKIKDLTIYYTKKQAIGIWKDLIRKRNIRRKEMKEKYFKQIKEQEQELDKVKQFPFRNYLIDFVVPVLNEGLVEVAHILPDDPVEFLAEYLYKRSFDVDQE